VDLAFTLIPGPVTQRILFSLSCRMSEGLSGRTLRKIPFLACSVFIHWPEDEQSFDSFLDAMELTIRKQFDDRSLMPTS
jgi:hypothetical protein